MDAVFKSNDVLLLGLSYVVRNTMGNSSEVAEFISEDDTLAVTFSTRSMTADGRWMLVVSDYTVPGKYGFIINSA